MKSQSPKNLTASQQNRRAFTLIELMITIVILLILIGLLVPAIGGARQRVQNANVRADITKFETSIAAFKQKFGIVPPSYIVLYENAGDWNSDPRSKNLIRQMWPQYDFASRDLNGNSTTGETITLNAGECLVFFLGGIWDSSGKTPNGFSKNPANPFTFTNAGGNREGPFFEFDIGRFVDTDSDNVPEYLDSIPSQTKPFLYFSSYDGRGYRDADITGTGMSHAYYPGDPTVALPTPRPVAFKPKSYQIISPGADNEYGVGGYYDPDKNFPVTPTNRQAETDNITNFTAGSLK